MVKVNGEAYKYAENQSPKSWRYDGQELMSSILIPSQSISSKIEIQITYFEDFLDKASLLNGKIGAFKRLQEVVRLMKVEIARENSWALLSDRVFAAEQVPTNISYNPKTITEQLEIFEKN